MDDYQPLWAEPMISQACYVASGDRLLHDDHFYEIVNRESGSEKMIFTIQEHLDDHVCITRKIVKRKDESIAYQKRLE